MATKSDSEESETQCGEFYEVEKIFDDMTSEGKQFFLVKWKGYSNQYNEWLEKSALNCDILVEQYLRETENKKPDNKKKRSHFTSSINPLKNHVEKEDADAFENDLEKLCEKYEYKWRVKQSLSDASKKVLIRVNRQLANRLARTEQQTKTLNENLAIWIDNVNEKNLANGVKPLKIENNHDLQNYPSNFQFITHNLYRVDATATGTWIRSGCHCEFAYVKGDMLNPNFGLQPIYECNSKCECGIKCMNRLLQRGRQRELCIFRKAKHALGWALKTVQPIDKDSFVLEYVGEVINMDEASKRYNGKTRDYVFDLDFSDMRPDYTIDATSYGNEGRFLNHSCDPNLIMYAVYTENLDPGLPRIGFFACKDIQACEELTFDYSMWYNNWQKENPNHATKMGRVKCLCRTDKCRGYVYFQI